MQPGDLVGQTLGHYRIERQIGYGGMSTVFLAEDIHLGREVTLKVFWPRPGETQDFLRRFAREARVLAQLDHPHILPVYDYGEEGERAFLVTPYMSGGSLKEVLHKRRAFPPSEAIQLISQVLPALQYAHERNLIHRDIKPGNLLFKGDGSLVLADFGLVKVVEGENREGTPLHTLTETGQTIAGTPEYMAPEQINGKAVPASDIYSLGIVLYEMVTGTRPFSGSSLFGILMQHVHEAPRAPRELNPYISLPLQAAILKALAKEPQQRFANPAAFQRALAQSSNPSSQPGIIDLENTEGDPYRTSQMASEHGPSIDWTQASTAKAATASPPPGKADARQQVPPIPPTVPVAHQPNNQLVLPVQPHAGNLPPTPLPPTPAWQMSQTVPPSFVSAPTGPPRRSSRTPLAIAAIVLALLAGLVASLFLTPLGSSLFGPHTIITPTPQVRGGYTPIPGDTHNMPPTLTSCPANGSRAAVVAPLVLGHDATLAYIVNESDSSGNPTFGTIKLFNTVSGAKTELAKTATTRITEAQVSNDGQWVLFAATVNGQSQLRMVRLDGQGLQTLLCAPTGLVIRGSQFSIDQKYVIFDEFPQNGAPTVELLNMQSGTLQTEMAAPATGLALLPRTWLDAHHIAMVGIVPQSDAPPQNIYILDIGSGAHQALADAREVFPSSQACWDFDSSYDAQTLFITQCTTSQPSGSSVIARQPTNGGSSTNLLSSPTLAFDTVRAIDNNNSNANLLALASDTSLGSASADPAHDGLYLVKTDGSAPQRLTSTSSGQTSLLNAYSQYFWANVARDDSLYALETVTPGNSVYALTYGPLNGGTPTTFASISDGTEMSIAGWTTT